MALVYSTDHGRICPGCRQSLTACICKAARPIPAGDGIVRVSREKQGRGGKTVTVVRGLMLDAIALTTTGKQLRAACGAGGTITMCMGSNWTSRCARLAMGLASLRTRPSPTICIINLHDGRGRRDC